jgi:hypothetical protein
MVNLFETYIRPHLGTGLRICEVVALGGNFLMFQRNVVQFLSMVKQLRTSVIIIQHVGNTC